MQRHRLKVHELVRDAFKQMTALSGGLFLIKNANWSFYKAHLIFSEN